MAVNIGSSTLVEYTCSTPDRPHKTDRYYIGLGTGPVPAKVPAETYGGSTSAESDEWPGIAPIADSLAWIREEGVRAAIVLTEELVLDWADSSSCEDEVENSNDLLKFLASATDDNVDTCVHAYMPSNLEHLTTEVVDGIEGTCKVTKHAFDATTLDATTLGTDGTERRWRSKGES